MEEKIIMPLNDNELDAVSGGKKEEPRWRLYTVQPGDHLIDIAKKLGVNLQSLVRWNKGKYESLKTDLNMIYVGWQLRYYK